MSYLGIALIFWRDFRIEGDDVVLGAALVFGSAVAYAAYQILAKPLIDRLGPAALHLDRHERRRAGGDRPLPRSPTRWATSPSPATRCR